VPPRNVPAPVRYFSRAEGGISHFHYLRDNLTLAWMHTRLLGELLLYRWPALLRHRRQWRRAGLALSLLLLCLPPGHAAESDPLVNPEHRIEPAASTWTLLALAFARQPDIAADFTERRQFSFKPQPVVLRGEVRVSASRGLSLHYLAPEERTVILDQQGVLLRSPAGQKTPPADPRAGAANDALLSILRLDLATLQQGFELYGDNDGTAWTLVLVPRTEALRRSVGRITVNGAAVTIRRIEIRRTPKQAIEILIAPPRPFHAFTALELKQYFR
jgi:hypothetical protein